MLLSVDKLLSVQELVVPSSHAVVCWRHPPQSLGRYGHWLRRRVAAATSWCEAAAHPGIGCIPHCVSDEGSHCTYGCTSQHARRTSFCAKRSTSARCCSGSGQHLPNARYSRLASCLPHGLTGCVASCVCKGSLCLLEEGWWWRRRWRIRRIDALVQQHLV